MPLAACIVAPSPWAPSTSLNGFIASGTSARCDWPSAPLYTRHIFGMLVVLSADLDAILLQRVVAQLEPQPRRVRQRHEAVDDRRTLTEELEPQGIAARVRERFQDEPRRTGRHRVDVDLRIVMRGE